MRTMWAGVVLALGCADTGSDAVTCAAQFPPASPEGEVWYVAPGGTGDGRSCDAPLGSIQSAIDAASAGGTVLLAPGSYPETLLAEKSVSIIGAVGPGTETVYESDPTDAVSVIIKVPTPDAIGVIIKRPVDTTDPSGVIIKAPAPALKVDGGDVVLRGVRIEAPLVAGVAVRSGSIVLEDCAIEGATPKAEGESGGVGVLIDAGSTGTVKRTRLTGNVTGIDWNMSGGTLESSFVSGNTSGGVLIRDSSRSIILQGNAIVANTAYGVSVLGGTGIILQNNAITETASVLESGQVPADGDGLFLGAGAVTPESVIIKFEANVVADNARLGVFLDTTRGVIIKNEVSRNGRGGVWVQRAGAGGDVTIEENTVRDNRSVGIAAVVGARGIILQNRISGTRVREGTGGSLAEGVGLFSGASARIEANTIADSARAGLLVDDAVGGAATTVSGNTVTGPRGIILQHPRAEPVAVGENAAEVETPAEALALESEAITGFAVAF